ncbi:MAG: cytochrome C [Bacteroidetes bacterium]|nr:cytochrome C [Bacteroidota bacterium]
MKNYKLLITITLLMLSSAIFAQTNDDCMACHEDPELIVERDGKEVSMMVNVDFMTMSVHEEFDCVMCHEDADNEDFPHADGLVKLQKVNCGVCHDDYQELFDMGVHGMPTKTDLPRPDCKSCHGGHMILNSSNEQAKTHKVNIPNLCAECHGDLVDTYKDTYHGKAYALGHENAPNCLDCHGSHNVYKAENPESMVGDNHRLETCKQCHPKANEAFTNYMTHATHHDHAALNFTYWFMTILLLSVFVFFGIHTLLWLPKSLKRRKKINHEVTPGPKKYYRRFNKRQRFTHLLIIISFLLLALTGMTLKFAHMPWANWIAHNILGSVETSNLIHRIAAVVTFGYFFFHLLTLFQLRAKVKKNWKEFLFGNNSLWFGKHDWYEMVASVKWFLGKGPRPQYRRWTYWEKFDYLAVFWGVAIIGLSGLILWFPEFFTTFLPGWVINVAQIVHSDEALLATGFIFTIHFFNTHLRPEAFPMDTVIFTGHVPVDEYLEDRPGEHEILKEEGRLEKVIVEKEFKKWWLVAIKIFGYTALAIGVIIIGLIVYSIIVSGI